MVIRMIAILVAGMAVGGSLLLNRARERAEYEDVIAARLARYAGQQR